MKQKYVNIISWIVFTLIIVGIIVFFYYLASQILKEHNVCAEIYGDVNANFLNWKGTLEYRYSSKYFNETHLACCIKEKFLDSDGQINYQRCTGIYPNDK